MDLNEAVRVAYDEEEAGVDEHRIRGVRLGKALSGTRRTTEIIFLILKFVCAFTAPGFYTRSGANIDLRNFIRGSHNENHSGLTHSVYNRNFKCRGSFW